MVGYSRFHYWRHPEALMHPPEVVPHEMEGHGMAQVLNLLGERIGQSRKPPHIHPHRQILPLRKAGGDMLTVGIPHDLVRPCPTALRGAVAGWAFLRRSGVQLFQHGVVNLTAKGFLDGSQVRLMPVCGQLHPMGQPSLSTSKYDGFVSC